MKLPAKTSLLIFSLIMGLNCSAFARNSVSDLRCEYKINPIGVDVSQPRLSWKIVSDEMNVKQSVYEIKVATSEQALKENKNLLWETGKIQSDQSVNIEYSGKALAAMQKVFWQVRIWDQHGKPTTWSTPASWETGLMESNNWKAVWITSPLDRSNEKIRPCSYFRKAFSATKKIQSARVYVSALGLYELQLNGQKVSTDLFTPGWTSYKNRIQYQTYDVTQLLKSDNTIGAIVGDGWYRGNIGWENNRNYYGDKTAIILQLHIVFADGTDKWVVTDNSWKASTGALLQSDIYNGETYDARFEQKGWSSAGFNDQDWQLATVLDHPKSILIAQQGVPVKAIQELQPIKLLKTPKGETVFDMGQNMVGWVRLKVSGKKGDKVTLKFAEVLDKEGNFYTANLRSAKATDQFILNGSGVEIFEPHFSFHGFRYVMIEDFPGTPELSSITGVVVHSEMQPTGNFACSDSMINQLQHNIQWGQKGNFLDVPTDCPQRDERLGWTGDAQVFCPTAAINYDVAAFFTKWVGDIAADQQPDGKVPFVVPDVLRGGGGATAWADVAIIIPWNIYLAYGDKRILEKQYPSMKAWVEYMRNRAGDDFLWTGDYHFGDWLAYATTQSDYPGATTEKDLIATAYYRYSSMLLSKIAAIIGKTDEAKAYSMLSDKIKTAFIHEYVTPAGRLVSHTQTAYSLALAFDLLPNELIPAAAKYLADDVRKFGHLTTGFVGTPLLCKTLSDNGYSDLAFMLVNRKEYPSWLYPVTQGATTIWERWDGQKPDGSFQDVSMNSFNHYAYGAIGEWLYRYVAGLNLDESKPGYQHFILAPHPGGGMTSAKIEFESMYGKIVSDWRMEGDNFLYQFTIPANSEATVKLIKSGKIEIQLNGKPLANPFQINTDTYRTAKLGSGNYTVRLLKE
jgi:alpha-L-rhamnosidase